MSKIIISSAIWLFCFFLNSKVYSIYAYYGLWISLISSLLIIGFHYKKIVAIFRFKPDNENYDFSGIEHLIKTAHITIGTFIFIIGFVYLTIDLRIRSTSLFDSATEDIMSEKNSDTFSFGMVTVNHFKYRNGDITYQLNVPVYSSNSKELIKFDVNNLSGNWEINKTIR